MATSTIKKDAPIIKRKAYSYKVGSVSAGKIVLITASNFGLTTPDGYTPLAPYAFYTSSSAVAVTGVRTTATGSATAMYARHVGSSAVSNVTAYLSMAYIRNDLWNSNR